MTTSAMGPPSVPLPLPQGGQFPAGVEQGGVSLPSLVYAPLAGFSNQGSRRQAFSMAMNLMPHNPELTGEERNERSE